MRGIEVATALSATAFCLIDAAVTFPALDLCLASASKPHAGRARVSP